MKPAAVIPKRDQSGFTLVELMVTLVIAFIITGAAYSAYKVQQKNYTLQEEVAVVQQNLRAGLEIMTREMRMAGYDPTESADAGTVTATAGRFRFTQDITNDPGTAADGDGDVNDPGEDVDFGFSNVVDANGDGIPDAGDAAAFGVQKSGGGGYQPITENIERIEFRYTLRDGTRTLAPTNAQLNQIEQVEISLLARSVREDNKYTDTRTYETASGAIIPPANDGYHRRMVITTLQLRNLGYGS